MKVKIKRLDSKAVAPLKKYASDFCYDVVAVSEEQVAQNVWKYGLGLAFEIERDWEAIIRETYTDCILDDSVHIDMTRLAMEISIDFRPRSSVWKTGMVLSNCVGTIDEDYRGEVCAVFYHVMPDMPRYKVGDRIGQVKLGFTLPMEFEIISEMSETERGSNGFGSTGQ